MFSPDGNRMAFVTNESGRLEAHVQAFVAGDMERSPDSVLFPGNDALSSPRSGQMGRLSAA